MAMAPTVPQLAAVPLSTAFRARLPERLERLTGALRRLPAMTEEKFLLVGERLREISSGLKTITENAAEAGRIMSGEEALRAGIELEALFREMEHYFLAANRTAEQAGLSLSGIMQELAQLQKLMVGLKDQVGNLRMLKLLTNIQSATLAARGEGFSNVAADIGNLSLNVQKRTTTIIAKTKALHVDLNRAIGMLSAFAVRQRHLGGMVIAAMRKDIAALEAMNSKCAAKASDASRESAAIFRQVNNLVVALQFQDITRQQMEHAGEALAGVRRRLGYAGQGAEPAEVLSACALQSVQLGHTAEELNAAVGDITGSLQSIADRSGDFAAGIHGLFVTAEEIGGASISDMDKGLEAMSTAFAENLVTNRNLTATMLSVSEAMAEITAFAADIDYIGSEIRLIALNAIIKAAHAGREGAAFGVIAETIKRQSVDICSQSAAVVAIIEAIGGHISDLHLTIGDNAEGSGSVETGAGIHRDKLSQTFVTLKQFSGNVRQLLEKTDQVSTALLQCIAETLAALDCREINTLLGREVVAELERLVREITPAGGRIISAAGLESHAASYTMGSERRVHQQFADSLSRSDWATAGGSPVMPAPQDSNFGDNVELF